MRLDRIIYGPHGTATHTSNYYYDETYLYNGWILNDANDSIGFGIQFQQTGTVNSIGLYMIEIVGTPDYAMVMTTISGQEGGYGEPYPAMNPLTKVGTLYSNSQWQDFDPLVVGSGWSWIDLNTPVNVTKGDFAALIIVPSGATTPDTSNYVEINDESTFWNTSPGEWRYSTYWNQYNWNPPIGVKYSDNAIQGFCITSPKWEEYSSSEEWGLEFRLPFQATCVGGLFNIYPSVSVPDSAPFKMILADSSDTELASVTVLDYDIVRGNFGNQNTHLAWDTATDPVLSPNTIYRLYLKPTSSEPITKGGFQLESEASKASLPGGTDWKWIERSTPASGWTTIADQYPYLSLALINITGVGGGGDGGATGGGTYGFIG